MVFCVLAEPALLSAMVVVVVAASELVSDCALVAVVVASLVATVVDDAVVVDTSIWISGVVFLVAQPVSNNAPRHKQIRRLFIRRFLSNKG